MKFSCDQCHAQYMIADEKVGQKGVKVKCKKCGNIIVVKPAADAAPAPAPEVAAPSASTAAASDNGAQTGQMSGAFDSLFGATVPPPGGETPAAGELSLGALASTAPAAPQASAARRPAGDKEWYVAIDDSQVGPIDVAEIEQRWDAREVDDDTLAWKAGMSDWQPVAEIPQLAYLVTERPQKKAQSKMAAASAGASMGGASPGMSAAASMGPMSFGGGASGGGEEVSWKPSAASALSSLVQEELVAAAAPKVEPQAARSGNDIGMPNFGATDLFGKGSNGSASSSDPFSQPSSPNWSVPTGPRKSGGFKPIYLIVAFMGVGLIALGALVWKQMTQPPPAAPVAAAPVAPVPVAPVAVAPVAPTPTPTPTPTPGPAVAEVKKPGPDKVKTEKPERPDKPERPEKKGGDIDDVFAEKPAAKASVKESLDKNDIVSGVRTHGPKVGPCLKEARGKNEIVPGDYKFILDWTIKADGSVANAKLKGPANVMGSSLPACFSRVMRNWSFPASKKDTPIANFPFGPIKIP